MRRIPYKLGDKLGTLIFLNDVFLGTKRRKANFLCSCGREFVADVNAVSTENTRSCGCMYKSTTGSKYPKVRNGLKNIFPKEYIVWKAMKARCSNPKRMGYAEYGGRGISVSDGWAASFETFISEMGPKPSPLHTIERVDNSKGYAKENCRWATRKEQVRNRRNTLKVEFKGQKVVLAALCEELRLSPKMVRNRLNLGWDLEKALFTPSMLKN